MAEQENISIMTEIERLAAVDPFEPFSIIMTSGERYNIGPADTVSMAQSVIHVALQRRGQYLLRQNQISEVVIPEAEL